jgi:hypothetical protein
MDMGPGGPRRRGSAGTSAFAGSFMGSFLGTKAAQASASGSTRTATTATTPVSDTTATGSTPQPPRANGGKGGKGKGFIGIIVAILVVAVLAVSIGNLASCNTTTTATSIAASTHNRTALDTTDAFESPAYTDLDGNWIERGAVLEVGLKDFYEMTGVMPYVYILPNGTSDSTEELQKEAEELYPKLFSDERHILLVFCDNNKGGFTCGYYVGSAARSVMDDEAIEILADYLNANYQNLNISEEQVFSNTFASTAERIMEKTTSIWPTVAVCAVIVVVAGVVFVLVRKQQAQRAAHNARMEEILQQPLETFGDTTSEAATRAQAYEQAAPAATATAAKAAPAEKGSSADSTTE